MRTAPVALAHLGDDVAMAEAARGVSALTHGDPLAGEACVLWCIALDRAIREERLDGAYDGLARLPVDRRPYWEARLYEAERMPPTAFDPGGFVVATFQAAYAAVIQTAIADRNPPDHLRAALTTALRAGHGTDTVATIAGALLGARWGYQEIPAVWLLLLHGWPGSNFVDLVHLAVRSVNRSAAGRRRASI